MVQEFHRPQIVQGIRQAHVLQFVDLDRVLQQADVLDAELYQGTVEVVSIGGNGDGGQDADDGQDDDDFNDGEALRRWIFFFLLPGKFGFLLSEDFFSRAA